MAIEKLDRYMASSHGEVNEVGAFVLYKDARAREDALLGALKSVANVLNERMDTLRVEKIIREIEATR
jgi:hypothetical protein